jgi:tetrahydrodipicolinate N-succinyltransferase
LKAEFIWRLSSRTKRVVPKEIFNIEGVEESVQEEVLMANRKKILDEVFELALQYDMNYFG